MRNMLVLLCGHLRGDGGIASQLSVRKGAALQASAVVGLAVSGKCPRRNAPRAGALTLGLLTTTESPAILASASTKFWSAPAIWNHLSGAAIFRLQARAWVNLSESRCPRFCGRVDCPENSILRP